MTDNYYSGQQTPSSLPPQPPYRSGSHAPVGDTKPMASAYRPDTSGIDATVEVPVGAPYAGSSISESTESFAAARSGSTDTMPRVQRASEVLGQSAPAPDYAGAAHAANARPQAAADAAVQPQPQYRAAAPDPAPKKSRGAGKTFLAGFLGAALACGIAAGGFAAWNAYGAGNHAAATNEAATVLLGTSDSSVINAVEEGQSLSVAVAAKALPSVVAIYNYQEESSAYGSMYGYGAGSSSSGSDDLVAMGMGSGVVISDEGYIITNYHVVEGAKKLTVTVDGVERDAESVGGDKSSDIAVIKVDNTEGLVAADIGDSDSLVIGEWVMTVGAPLGLEQSVATGVVSATNRSTIMDNSSSTDLYGYYTSNYTPEYTYYPNMIQTDAVINPGNSGGALVNANGKLIGINSMLSSYSQDYAGVGFAIPINYAIGIAEDIIAGKEPTHAALGVSISQVNPQTAKRYNLSVDSGAYIADIVAGSGAADSDLKVGDIITAINGKKVTSTTDVTLDVRGYEVGDTVTVTVNRDGESVDVDVVLSSDADLVYSSDSSSDSREKDEGRDGNTGRDEGFGQDQGYGQGDRYGYSEDELRELMELMELLSR